MDKANMHPSVMLTCTVCGFRFDPAEHPSCGTCPLHAGCTMACCPNCGTSNINPDASRLATWMKSILKGKNHAQSDVLAHSNPD
jgi:hypothetical protein